MPENKFAKLTQVCRGLRMIKGYIKDNKNVIIFFVLFAIFLNLGVIGICHLIPERLRSNTWFVAPDYEVKMVEKTVQD